MSKKPKAASEPKRRKQPTKRQEHRTTDDVAWRLSSCDKEMWPILSLPPNILIGQIIPFLCEMEKDRWSVWLTSKSKNIHKISIERLNPGAKNRLDTLQIEVEEVLVMHMDSTHCIYGYLMDGICSILWYDPNHGDNDTCVCRSRLKHT